MKINIKQFGYPTGEYISRRTVYGIVINSDNKILVIDVTGVLHLPGGGIEDHEKEIIALERELFEEAGCKASNFSLIGKANQFYAQTKIGPMNKLATFYTADLLMQDNTLSKEIDHKSKWLSKEEIESSNMADFQKWAVMSA